MQNYTRFVITGNNHVVWINTTACHSNMQLLGYNRPNRTFGENNTFQERLLLCLQKHGLSQVELCKMLNETIDIYKLDRFFDNVSYSKALISQYCLGKCVAKHARMEFLAKFFGVSYAWMDGSANLESELIGRQNTVKMLDQPIGYINATRRAA